MAKTKAAAKAAPSNEPKRPSASSMIRDWMKVHPEVMGNKEIAEAMGGDIKPSQVAAVKMQDKKKSNDGTKRKSSGVNGRSAVEFIKEAGGLDNAISLLMTVKAIQEAA